VRQRTLIPLLPHLIGDMPPAPSVLGTEPTQYLRRATSAKGDPLYGRRDAMQPWPTTLGAVRPGDRTNHAASDFRASRFSLGVRTEEPPSPLSGWMPCDGSEHVARPAQNA
jgi:hypothetical protein